MAFLKAPKTEEEINKLTPTSVRKAYQELANDYSKIREGKLILCPKCGDYMSKSNFYTMNDYKVGYYPICKRCLLKMVEQREKRDDPPNETKASVQKVLQMMDLPYIDSLYEAQKTIIKMNPDKSKRTESPFLAYLVPLRSLPQYSGLKWKDSEFTSEDLAANEVQVKVNQKAITNGRKRFGNYPVEDLMFLENEYEDWVSRYECNTKAQETIFERLAFKKWEINKATREGKQTKDLDKTYQELLATANVQPRQNVLDPMADAQTLGTLIQKYEETRPLPNIDPELEDVDKIGLYIDTFYRGHASKMLGLKNRFSNLYEKVMARYTVKRPEYNEETDSEVLFDKIFSKVADEDK